MIDYNEINDFIIKVFNYYNGRINPINKATLDINWANQMASNVGGYSRLPNIVIINPMVIIRFYNNDEFTIKIAIIETIIHELYHSDQILNYKLYASDINYNKFIEHSCEVQTILYVVGHLQEIYNTFGVDACLSSKKDYRKWLNYWDLPGTTYQRRYYYDHIFMCIDDMCSIDIEVVNDVYNFIKSNIENKNNIIININNERINVCLDGVIMPIDEFNKIIIKYVCTGLHNVKHEITYDMKTKEMIIDIETEILNVMCKKV